MVMNKGRIEEIGPAEAIYHSPKQPYTQQVIAAIPDTKLENIQRRQAAPIISTHSLQIHRT